MSTQLHRITWVKNFQTGLLAGLQVRCSAVVDKSRCADFQLYLNASTPEHPNHDLLTGNECWASGVGCEEHELKEETPVSTSKFLAEPA